MQTVYSYTIFTTGIRPRTITRGFGTTKTLELLFKNKIIIAIVSFRIGPCSSKTVHTHSYVCIAMLLLLLLKRRQQPSGQGTKPVAILSKFQNGSLAESRVQMYFKVFGPKDLTTRRAARANVMLLSAHDVLLFPNLSYTHIPILSQWNARAK